MELPKNTIKSILAVDCGSVNTTAILIEQVTGHYRIMATSQAVSTYGAPWNDISLGAQEAIQQIEQATGRTLLSSSGWPIVPKTADQQGVDAFLVVSSAGDPLPITLVGLIQDISLATARRAAATTYTHVNQALSLDDAHTTIEAQIQAIQEAPPEVILMVGGTDDGAKTPVVDIATMIAMALRVLPNTQQPDVFFAGNIEARVQVAEILGAVATKLRAIDNIRPTLDIENLALAQVEFETLYVQRRMLQLPGFDKLQAWSKSHVGPASRSFEKVVAYLGQQDASQVLGVDVGSGTTVIAAQANHYHGATVRSDAGIGHSLASFLKQTPISQIQRWLPFEMDETDLHHHLLNKSLYPATIPTTYKDLMIEQAIARETIKATLAQARMGWPRHQATGLRDVPWNLIVGSGRTLAQSPKLGYAALTLLDAIEPWGSINLALDQLNVMNILGALGAIQPVAAVEVIQAAALTNLGTIIAPLGHGPRGKTALTLQITPGNHEVEPQVIDVPYGSIKVIDLPHGEKTTLEIRPTRYFDIGLGQPGRGAVTEVEGGVLGIIVDARGRPLRLPEDDLVRQEQIQQWLDILTT